uniref:Methyltransferase type 11 domain-containing protein n=1 Tax=Rhizochromulina marina TaxID=1034831 RepID=A0A7S2SBX8_9STRA|mmetsp:Transcript_27935/g.81781  ORF Transcript_27935/g.81781 Transcript_27935/m.81781 type:complete len:330 (+) Transcript_27935:381-1370(+)
MGRGGYGTVDFWDDYYVTDRPEPYDWFFSCSYLGGVIGELVSPHQDILMVGCGNSPFSQELHDAGFPRLTNVDNCALVIEQQRQRYPDLHWEVEDVRHLSYPADTFDVIFDKGLLDNLFCYQAAEDQCDHAMREFDRVLRPGGRYVVISFHPFEEIRHVFTRNSGSHDWHLTEILLRNPRWPEIRTPCFSLVIAEKPSGAVGEDSAPISQGILSQVSPESGESICLTEEEAQGYRDEAERLRREASDRLKARQREQRQVQSPPAVRAASSANATPPQPPLGTMQDQLQRRRSTLRQVPPPSEPVVHSDGFALKSAFASVAGVGDDEDEE